MPSGSYLQVHVKCPYYKTDDGSNRISCEGIIPGSKLTSYFKHTKDFEAQMRIYCTGEYWYCEICASNDRKYEDD